MNAPEIVSSASSVMTVMVCIWLTSRRIVAENVRVLSLFGTLPGYECGRGCLQCGGIIRLNIAAKQVGSLSHATGVYPGCAL
jgi:hypothetical protein